MIIIRVRDINLARWLCSNKSEGTSELFVAFNNYVFHWPIDPDAYRRA